MNRWNLLILSLSEILVVGVLSEDQAVKTAQDERNCRENAQRCFGELLDKSDIANLIKNLETKTQLDNFCREKGELMKCAELYSSCLTKRELEFYDSATSGIKKFHGYSCYKKREELSENVDCFFTTKNNSSECADGQLIFKTLSQLQTEDKCCAIDQYHVCVMKPLIAKCGFRRAELMSELIERYFSILTRDCKGYDDYICESHYDSAAMSFSVPLKLISLLSILMACLKT